MESPTSDLGMFKSLLSKFSRPTTVPKSDITSKTWMLPMTVNVHVVGTEILNSVQEKLAIWLIVKPAQKAT